jgi:hypothetical protein
MLHTPDGSLAEKLIGQGSPGGFQMCSPGDVWYQRLLFPIAVRLGD